MLRALPLLFLAACAPGYASLQAGPVIGLDRDNGSGFETGDGLGKGIELGTGIDTAWGSVGATLGYQSLGLHGTNGHGERRSADGEDLDGFFAGIGAEPSYRLGRFEPYVRAGGGLVHLWGLNDTDITGYYEACIGSRFDITGSLALDAGGCFRGIPEAQLGGFDGSINTVRAGAGLRMRF